MRYPIGIQSFQKLRRGGYVYVDKTPYLIEMLKRGGLFFLGRPRRFGKSLFLSMVESYFNGEKELFQGLAIADYEHAWERRPIFHLDLNIGKYENLENLIDILNDKLEEWEGLYGRRESEVSPAQRFAGLVKRASIKSGKGVAVLIDEYDNPLSKAVDNPRLQEIFRNELKPFYSVLKSMDEYIEFAMLTGVSRLGHMSIFSDLNNLQDLTMKEAFADICGITHSELQQYFADEAAAMAKAKGVTAAEMTLQLTECYDGYRFSPSKSTVFNPYSLFNALQDQRLNDYWFLSGTPTMMVRMLKKHHYQLDKLEGVTADEALLTGVDNSESTPIALLYQTGYLTIKDYNEEYRYFTLGFPNMEVKRAFFLCILPYYANVEDRQSRFEIDHFVRDLRDGNANGFMARLESLLANVPYDVIYQREAHFQNVLYILFMLIGLQVEVERHISNGRIDMVARTDRFVYIFEFKFDGKAHKAATQIEDKDYAKPFAADGVKIIKIGVNFDSKKRNISDWELA